MVGTVAEFEKDELREALRKAGEKAVREGRVGARTSGDREQREAPATPAGENDPQGGSAATATGPDKIELSTGTAPDDLKCERAQ